MDILIIFCAAKQRIARFYDAKYLVLPGVDIFSESHTISLILERKNPMLRWLFGNSADAQQEITRDEAVAILTDEKRARALKGAGLMNAILVHVIPTDDKPSAFNEPVKAAAFVAWQALFSDRSRTEEPYKKALDYVVSADPVGVGYECIATHHFSLFLPPRLMWNETHFMKAQAYVDANISLMKDLDLKGEHLKALDRATWLLHAKGELNAESSFSAVMSSTARDQIKKEAPAIFLRTMRALAKENPQNVSDIIDRIFVESHQTVKDLCLLIKAEIQPASALRLRGPAPAAPGA